MSELERLRFDVRELTLSRDGWRERCEKAERELAELREKVQGWGCRVKEMQERQNFSFDVDTCDELAEEMGEEAGK